MLDPYECATTKFFLPLYLPYSALRSAEGGSGVHEGEGMQMSADIVRVGCGVGTLNVLLMAVSFPIVRLRAVSTSIRVKRNHGISHCLRDMSIRKWSELVK